MKKLVEEWKEDILLRCLNDLILLSAHTQELPFAKDAKHLDPKAYLKEYCTVRCQTSRRAGHSTALIRASGDLFDVPLVFSLNRDCIKRLKERWFQLYLDTPPWNLMYLLSKAGIKKAFSETKDTKVEAVIVDIASMVSSADLEAVYDGSISFLSDEDSDPFFVVLIG